jgi:hypothetical protein
VGGGGGGLACGTRGKEKECLQSSGEEIWREEWVHLKDENIILTL